MLWIACRWHNIVFLSKRTRIDVCLVSNKKFENNIVQWFLAVEILKSTWFQRIWNIRWDIMVDRWQINNLSMNRVLHWLVRIILTFYSECAYACRFDPLNADSLQYFDRLWCYNRKKLLSNIHKAIMLPWLSCRKLCFDGARSRISSPDAGRASPCSKSSLIISSI